jgi:hypothetical protein
MSQEDHNKLILKRARDDPYEAIEMLVNDVFKVSEELRETKKAYATFTSPGAVEQRDFEARFRNALSILHKKWLENEAFYELRVRLNFKRRSKVSVMEVAVVNREYELAWKDSATNPIPFELSGYTPEEEHLSSFPAAAFYTSVDDLCSKELDNIVKGRYGWQIDTLDWKVSNEPTITMIWKRDA